MPDGTVPERIAKTAEQKAMEASKEILEASLESGDVESIKTTVTKEAEDAIIEVKDYMSVATDPSDPALTDDVRKKAEEIEAEIRAALDEVKAKIDRTAKGEEAPSASPEAAIADLKKENVSEAAGEAATVAQTETAPAPSAPAQEKPLTPPIAERAEAPIGDLMKRFGDIVEEYKGSNKSASKLLQKKMLKLMVDANPDTYPNDVRVAEIRSMIGRLKMAFDGDARAWSTPQGASFEADFANLQKTFTQVERKEENAEAVREAAQAEESSAESAAESLTPESVMSGFSSVAAELFRSKGTLSPELRGRYTALMQQRLKLKYGKDRESWKPMEAAADNLSNVIDRFSSHPVGMLQGLATYLSEHPDVAARAGVSAEDVKKQLADSAKELASNPRSISGSLGQIASGLLNARGEFSPDMVSTLDRLRDELDLVKEHEGEKMHDEGWKNAANALDHLQMIYATTDTPVDRLKGVRAFIGDNPEIASEAGLSMSAVDAAIAQEESGGLHSGDAKAPASEQAQVTTEALPKIDLSELEGKADKAFQTGDEEAFGKVVEQFEAGSSIEHANLLKEIDRLERLSPELRDAAHDRTLERLHLQVSLNEKMLEWRKSQLALMQMRKELATITVELDKASHEFEQRSGAQTQNLLAQHAEEGRVLAIPEADPKIALKQRIDELTTKKEDLLKRIGEHEANLAGLTAEIDKLNALLKRTSGEEEKVAKAAKEEKQTGSVPDREGPDGMPSAQAPDLKTKAPRQGVDIDKGIKKTGEYIHDPGQAVLDAMDAADRFLSSKPKPKKND